MSTLTKERVLEALQQVFDPEYPVNIVELGLIYNVDINEPESKVHVTMTLTTPGCGMARYIALDAKEKVKAIPGVADATITVVWEPAWDPSLMSDEARAKLGMA